MNYSGKSLILLGLALLAAAGIWLNLTANGPVPATDGCTSPVIPREAPVTPAPQGMESEGEESSRRAGSDFKRKSTTVIQEILNDPVTLGFIALLLVAALLIRTISRAVRMPAGVTVVPIEVLPNEMSDYVVTTTNILRSLGFSQQLDFHMPELPQEGFYRLMEASRGKHTVLISEIKAPGLAEPARYIEFQTVLEDGTKINTNNNPLPTPFIPPPHVFVETYSDMQDLSELYRRHIGIEEKVLRENPQSILLQTLSDFPGRMSRDWKEVIEYQAACGLLRQDRDGAEYHGTSRLFFRYLGSSLKAWRARFLSGD